MQTKREATRALRVVVLLTALFAWLLPTSPALASVNCDLSSGVIDVSGWSGSELVIKRSGSNFSFSSTSSDSTTCGGTMTNTNRVEIDLMGTVNAERVAIDLSGGQFAPGITNESSGLSEIEFEIDLGGCSCIGGGDRLYVRGGSGADTIRFAGGSFALPDATPGANLNDDNDVDLFVDPSSAPPQTLVEGNNGNDTLRGGLIGHFAYPYRMTVSGGEGNDDLSGGSGNDGLNGNDGDDTMTGNSGQDVFTESDGTDEASGGADDDEFREAAAYRTSTTYSGGDGVDKVEYATGNPVTVDADGVADDGELGEGDNVGVDIENMRGGWGSDVLKGNELDNELNGAQGNDKLHGGFGDDVVIGDFGDDVLYQRPGPDGADSLFGGGHFDTIAYGRRSVDVSVSLNEVADDGAAGEGDNVQEVERVETGSGDDTVSGTTGAETFAPGTGTDTADYSNRTEGLSLTLDGVANDGAPSEGDNLGSGVENVIGGSGIDEIVGDYEDNLLSGLAGDDELSGGIGNDELRGGLDEDKEFGNTGNDTFFEDADDNGADELHGGLGRDAVDYRARTTGVTVALNDQPDDGGVVENDDVASDIEDAFGGTAKDFLLGFAGANGLFGGSGADEMFGGKGGDQLMGGHGDDLVEGNDGNDDLSGGPQDDVLKGGPGEDNCAGGGGEDTLSACE